MPDDSLSHVRTVAIEVIFDPVCPWCFIGKRRLEIAVQSRTDLSVDLNWRPFLLNPDLPDDGIDRTAYLLKKFGSEARVRRIYGAIADAGQSVEIRFAFDQIRRTPNTVNAHRLVKFSADFGRASDAVEELFMRYFIRAENIGDFDVLCDIAAELDLPVESLRAYLSSDQDVAWVHDENTRAHRLGINGVPSFVFTGGMVISGAQESPVLARMLDAARIMPRA